MTQRLQRSCSWTKEHNNGLQVSPTVSMVMWHSAAIWDLYQKWVHTPTVTIVITPHSLALWCLLIQALQIVDRYPQWSLHVYCESFMHVKICDTWLQGLHCRCEDGKSLSAPKTVVLNRLYLLPRLLRRLMTIHTMCQVTCLHQGILRPVEMGFFELVAWNYWETIAYSLTVLWFSVFLFCLLLHFNIVLWQWGCSMLNRFVHITTCGTI